VLTVEADTIGVGDSVQFTVTVEYPDGNTVDVAGVATWISSDTAVATIEAGLVTGEGVGTTEITAIFDGEASDPITLTVAAPAALQWWAILAIIAALLAAGLFLFFLLRRKREQPGEAAA